MKQLTLTKVGARLLELNISQKTEGFNPRDSRKWDKIADKLLSSITDYDEPIQALFDEAQATAAADLPLAEREETIRRLNREIRALDDSVGTQEVTIVLEDTEIGFIAEAWWTLKFPGDRRTRALTGSISDALDGAVEVTIEAGKVVPVDKAMADAKTSPNGKHLARVR